MSINVKDADNTLLIEICTRAAEIGAKAWSDKKSFEAFADTRKGYAKDAADSVAQDARKVAGFDTHMFRGLSAVANMLGRAFNDLTTPQARKAAEGAASSFMSSFTDATDKTKKGGTLGAYVTHIMLGQNGERLRVALNDRLDYWYESVRLAGEDKSKDAAKNLKRAKDRAAEFLTVCGDAPKEDGSWPDGRKPRHNGRRERKFPNGVVIPSGRGTDRKAQFAQASTFYHTYGDAFLDPNVLDAFLSNGGKYEYERTIADLASDAVAAIEALQLAGGTGSAQGAFLIVAHAELRAIVTAGGFTASNVAVEPEALPESRPETADEAEGAAEGEDAGEGGTEAEAEAAPDTTPERKPRGRAARGGLG